MTTRNFWRIIAVVLFILTFALSVELKELFWGGNPAGMIFFFLLLLFTPFLLLLFLNKKRIILRIISLAVGILCSLILFSDYEIAAGVCYLVAHIIAMFVHKDFMTNNEIDRWNAAIDDEKEAERLAKKVKEEEQAKIRAKEMEEKEKEEAQKKTERAKNREREFNELLNNAHSNKSQQELVLKYYEENDLEKVIILCQREESGYKDAKELLLATAPVAIAAAEQTISNGNKNLEPLRDYKRKVMAASSTAWDSQPICWEAQAAIDNYESGIAEAKELLAKSKKILEKLS